MDGLATDSRFQDLFLMKIRDAFLPLFLKRYPGSQFVELSTLVVHSRFMHPQFQTDVTKPMLIDQIADHEARLALRCQRGQCDSPTGL